jgi:hypothetical protein
MTNEETSAQIKKLHIQVERLLQENYSRKEIIGELQNQGLEPYYIQTIIENVQDDKSDKKSFRNSMIMGIFYVAAGSLINIFSYNIAESGNSLFFYLFLGIIVFGIVTIIRGFILYKR